ncbi:ferritin-like domain-containing protein [Chitinimonas arctica]|uniref:Ferritin-like domain-containing protein n=1 Tax=Chitinimonas arctica TaxID=2594795 RepID=A0A516SCA6_9NEIS|nr:ferritin-like domain-containing protein [Chitinimonas arctica]QDQ25782.1 ferritin-like domain-containing protein [Chitinimonas arctica]
MAAPLFPAVREALCLTDPYAKADAAQAIWAAWQAGQLDHTAPPCPPPDQAGRPPRPQLVPPQAVPRRRLGTPAGRAALVHAITHIEFNAINLALDAAGRFHGLPRDYYGDWLRVAAEEAHHFRLLSNHLNSLAYAYGDFPAHDGLWVMAEKTAGDVLTRMTLVPRLLEARGLDVTPAMQARLLAAGDRTAAGLLDIIFRDEVGHVAVGNRWFRWLCAERGLDPAETFRDHLVKFEVSRNIGELNIEARLQAGFELDELAVLQAYALSAE